MDGEPCDLSAIRSGLLSMESRTLTVSSAVPAFLAKLWKLVEDPSSDHLISWSLVSVLQNIKYDASTSTHNMASRILSPIDIVSRTQVASSTKH